MFVYWKKLDNLAFANRLLVGIIASLVLVVVILSTSLARMPSQFRFFITPTLAATGGEIYQNDIPDSAVYSFVATLFPMLNSWSGEDKQEYLKTIHSYKPYLSPRHLELLNDAYSFMKKAGLTDKAQTASLYSGFESGLVQKISPDLWQVHIKLRLTQRINEKNPMVIADKVVSYKVRVMHVALSHQSNPFELVLDGYSQKETVERNLLDEEKI
ncbi:TPA: DUF2895 family protein [Legionella pneumophila]|nr:DUF2895 family protein [Legionella pneumophila]HBD7283620.1 DUF2895 family protein [Legionella pneumophila]HEN8241139.1 DUF2895 family protein [Legionella pneumophila]